MRHAHGRWRWRDEAARAGSEATAHVWWWWVDRRLGRDKVAVGRDRGWGLRPGNGTLKVLAGAGTTALAASSAPAATAAGAAAATSVIIAAVGAGNPVELGVGLAPVGIGRASGAGRSVVTDVPLPRLSLDSGGPGRSASSPGKEPDRQGLLLGKLGISDAVRGRGGAEAVIRVNGRATRIGLGRHG